MVGFAILREIKRDTKKKREKRKETEEEKGKLGKKKNNA